MLTHGPPTINQQSDDRHRADPSSRDTSKTHAGPASQHLSVRRERGREIAEKAGDSREGERERGRVGEREREGEKGKNRGWGRR